VDEQELKAVVEARKELGPEHEEHLISGFVDRMSKEIDRRMSGSASWRRASRGRRPFTPGRSASASRSSRSPVASAAWAA